jgi:hypothetical protein
MAFAGRVAAATQCKTARILPILFQRNDTGNKA